MDCAIALGSNLGDCLSYLEQSLQELGKTPAIEVISHSKWYKTKAVGPPQPDYLNGCALLKVQLTPDELLKKLQEIEEKFGRVREEHWGARTLDLDLLLYENLILNLPNLQIPHPRLCQRAFVLVPLAEIAPDWIDPLSGKTIKELLASLLTNIRTMSPEKEPPELIQQRLFYRGRKFDFTVSRLRLPLGVEGEWECIRHPGGALAVPITYDGKLVLVRQYRFTIEGRLLEFPAGTIEPQESPAQTIARELEEETGYRANQWRFLGQFPLAPGYSDEYIHAFLAEGLEKLPHPPQQDEDEDIDVVLMTAEELEQAILGGEAIDAKTITSFYLAKPFLR